MILYLQYAEYFRELVLGAVDLAILSRLKSKKSSDNILREGLALLSSDEYSLSLLHFFIYTQDVKSE